MVRCQFGSKSTGQVSVVPQIVPKVAPWSTNPGHKWSECASTPPPWGAPPKAALGELRDHLCPGFVDHRTAFGAICGTPDPCPAGGFAADLAPLHAKDTKPSFQPIFGSSRGAAQMAPFSLLFTTRSTSGGRPGRHPNPGANCSSAFYGLF